VGIHLLPLGLLETVDERLNEFREKRRVSVEAFLFAYQRLCGEAAGRLRTLHNPADYPPVEEVRSRFTFTWQYVSYGVPRNRHRNKGVACLPAWPRVAGELMLDSS
jgi:hypothetical protein